MTNHLKHLSIVLAALLLFTACSSNASDVASDESTTTVAEEVSDTPVSIEPLEPTSDGPTEAPEVDEPASDDAATTTTEPLPTCTAPVSKLRWVDVAIDDPDGGLNMRSAAGIENDIIGVFPRSSDLITTGACVPLGDFEWWEVSSTAESEVGELTGWVSSRFLSDIPVFNPGLGKAFVDLDNVGVGGETLDELAANLATAYGFDEDVVITMIGDVVGADAQGGSVVYEMTGLKDDASNGYRFEIDFLFDKMEEEGGGEITSYTAINITNYSLCSRGVTDDGLCT